MAGLNTTEVYQMLDLVIHLCPLTLVGFHLGRQMSPRRHQMSLSLSYPHRNNAGLIRQRRASGDDETWSSRLQGITHDHINW